MTAPVYSVEVLSPDGKAATILPLELWDIDQARKLQVALESTAGVSCNLVSRSRWEPVK